MAAFTIAVNFTTCLNIEWPDTPRHEQHTRKRSEDRCHVRLVPSSEVACEQIPDGGRSRRHVCTIVRNNSGIIFRSNDVALGEGNTLAIRAVSREAGSTPPRVVIDVAAPEASNVDLFAEGPTPDWSLPLPELITKHAGTRRFAFDLAGMPPNARLKDSVIKITAVSGEGAIEASAPLN